MKNRVWAIVALVVAVSAAATGTSSADSSAILEGMVQIQVTGRHTGPQPSPVQHRIAHGRFALSGALSDRGIFEDYRHANSPRVRMLFGAKGTIAIAFVGPSSTWRIAQGTFAYTGLRGRGHGRGPHSPGRFEITMIGRGLAVVGMQTRVREWADIQVLNADRTGQRRLTLQDS